MKWTRAAGSETTLGVPNTTFDDQASNYAAAVDRSISFTGRDAAFFARRKVALLQRLLRHRGRALAEADALDVGCGQGMTDQFLIDGVKSLRGVDLSEAMVEEAKRNVPSAQFDSYDGRKLPYEDESFDLVLAVCVLHHVPEAERMAFARELNRVTRPGGFVAIFEHNPINPLTRRAVSHCELDQGVVLLWPRQVRRLLESTGARDSTCHYLLFTPVAGKLGTVLDQSLRRIPVGGQHVVIAESS